MGHLAVTALGGLLVLACAGAGMEGGHALVTGDPGAGAASPGRP